MITGLLSVLVSGLFKLTLAIIGIIAARLTLFWMDKYLENTQTSFAIWLRQASDLSRAIYHAGRFIAVAIIIGCAIG